MNKHIAIASIFCVSITAGLFAEASTSAKDRIRELAEKPVDSNVARQWLELIDEEFYIDFRQDILQVVAPALLYARKMGDYSKSVKPQMEDSKEFEESLRSECPVCEGSGKQHDLCQHCHGSGKCQFAGCNGGYVEVRRRTFGSNLQPSVSYSAGEKKCSSCSGTGECRYCHGEKELTKTCGKCGGNGWVVKPSKVLETYRNGVTHIQEKMNEMSEDFDLLCEYDEEKGVILPMRNLELGEFKSSGNDIKISADNFIFRCDQSKGSCIADAAQYHIPLEMQSKRITFEIKLERKGELNHGSVASVFSGELTCSPSVDVPDTLELGKWVNCEIEIQDEAVLVRAGDHVAKTDREGWFRLSKIKFDAEAQHDYSVRNIRSYPTNKHRLAARLYNQKVDLTSEKGIAVTEKAANLGLAEAQTGCWTLSAGNLLFKLAEKYGEMPVKTSSLSGHEREVLKEANKWLLKAAEQGDVEISEMVGKLKFFGEMGFEESKSEAFKYFRWAASGGSLKGMVYYGMLLIKGHGVEHDMQKAQSVLDKFIGWYNMSKESETMDNIEKGMAYYFGAETYILGKDGAMENRELALKYLRIAKVYGYEPAQKRLLELQGE